MAEKRKHGVFAEDTSVHPSRRAAIDGPTSTPKSTPAVCLFPANALSASLFYKVNMS